MAAVVAASCGDATDMQSIKAYVEKRSGERFGLRVTVSNKPSRVG